MAGTTVSALVFLLVVVIVQSAAQQNDRSKRDLSFFNNDNDNEAYLLGLLRNRPSAFLGSGLSSSEQKRSAGLLDFGLSRGLSGAEAAKARLGLKMANDPYGPGRR